MKKNKKSFFIKLFSFITILATLPVIILGLFSYLKSSEMIQSNIAKEKQQSIYQIQTNFEQVLKTTDLSMTNFVTSYQLKRTLGEPLTEYQFKLYNHTVKELNQLQRFDVGIDNILLVSFKKNWMLDNSGLQRISKEQSEEISRKYFSLPNKSSWIIEKSNQVLIDSEGKSSCSYYINLVKQLPLNSSHKNGLSITYLPICNFSDILTNNLESEMTIVLNKDYQVVGHSDFKNIGKDFSNKSFVSNIRSSEDSIGQFDITKNEKDYKVTYRKSGYNNWTYISLIEMSVLNKQVSAIGWFTIIICSIMLIGILVISFIASRKFYKPINKLAATVSKSFTNTLVNGKQDDEFGRIEKQIGHMLEQNDQLESKLQSQVVQLKQFFMAKLLQGKISNDELTSKLASFNFNQTWKRFSVLTLQIDSLGDTKYQDSEEDLLLFTINTMIEELIPITNRMKPIVVNRAQVTIYLSRHEMDNEYTEAISTLTQVIQKKVKEELDLSISFGLSKPYTELLYTNQAYKESLEALKYTLKYGPDSIIFFENLDRDSSFHTFFPRQIENELFDAIKIGDNQKVNQNLNKLLESLFDNGLNHTQYEITIVRFLNNLIELTETLGVEVLEFKKYNSLFDQLYKFRTQTEVVNWFKDVIIYPMMNKVEERTQSQYKNISDEIIHIVQQEYNTDLTLSSIAIRLHYNPNYLSSIFRKETNASFSEYLSLFRLNMAKKWLVETDMTVKEIAEKLKYNNSQNFIRSFRKMEGTTPGKYRKDKNAK